MHSSQSPQSPQVLPQPSSPQRAPSHWGTHTQVPEEQVWCQPHEPQLWPQPSSPQSCPAQLGMHWQNPFTH
jgi:hypothetical protein